MRRPTRRLVDALQAALAELAPDILSQSPDAHWDEPREAAVLDAALGAAPQPDDVIAARVALADVLRRGREEGVWDLSIQGDVEAPTPTHRRPSRLSVVRRGDVLETIRRREALAHALPHLRDCTDPAVLAGLLMIAATDYSAILLADLFAQVPGCATRIATAPGVGFAWFDFRLGVTGHLDGTRKRRKQTPWHNVRRWFLDPVSLQLVAALRAVGTPPKPTPAECLEAALRHLGLDTCSPQTLLRTARAFWTLRLDQANFHYATAMPLAPSLPDHAWRGLLTGRRTPAPVEEAAEPPSSVAAPPVAIRPVKDFDPHRHVGATRALLRLLRIGEGRDGPRPSKRTLLGLLDGWAAEHDPLGGWVQLLGAWARAVAAASSWRVNNKLAVAGLLRYGDGFAQHFVELFVDLPPDVLRIPDPGVLDALAVRLDALRHRLEPRKSAATDLTGLRSFLRFVESVGGPAIELDSAWRAIVPPRNVRANVLAPREYRALLGWLGRHGARGTYAQQRNRVIAMFGYRLGVRWEEVQTRQLIDLQVARDARGRWHGWLAVDANDYFRGKRVSSLRKLPLELLLTAEEMEEVARFRALALAFGGSPRPPSDALFADAGRLSSPPCDADTHDVIQAGMRRVSGDPTLEFHSLRHSAATFVALRMLEPHGSVFAPAAWLVDAPEVCGEDWFDNYICYAARATRRSERDGARLYAVSKVLGHIDPDTSMRSYIHLFDVVHAAHVRRECTLPAAVRAYLDGIAVTSVYRFDSRQRDEADLSPEDLW